MATEQTYCYHCRSHHPRNEMRLIVTKTGKRWRCIRSIEATQQGAAAREAYGRQISEINKAESKSRRNGSTTSCRKSSRRGRTVFRQA
jgi:hypothetical protein